MWAPITVSAERKRTASRYVDKLLFILTRVFFLRLILSLKLDNIMTQI